MATVNIYISKQPTGTGLYLTDSEGHSGNKNITSTVKKGDTVVWQLKPGGGIDALTAITEKAGSEDIFSSDPASLDPTDPKADWRGTVSKAATGMEAYSIGYKIGDTPYTDDPELEVDDDG